MFSRQNRINAESYGKLRFQIVDIYAKDEGDELIEYKIHLFGITEKGESVHVQVDDFRPFFYVRFHNGVNQTKASIVNNFIKTELEKFEYDYLGCRVDKFIDFQGFSGYDKRNYLKIVCRNRKICYMIRDLLSRNAASFGKASFYETKLEPFLRFLHINKIQPAGWVEIDCDNYKGCSYSKCQIDVKTNWKLVKPYETTKIAPFLQASFDIECTSGDGKRFPDATFPEDKVIQIGTTVYKMGDTEGNKKPIKHILTLDTCDEIPGVIVEACKTERELLTKWTQFINKLDPDIITGYNIYGFDFKYLYDRAKLLGITTEFCDTSRIRHFYSELTEKKLSSSALGFNEMYYLNSPGRLLIDLFKVVQRDYNFTSYKLDNVAGEFIKSKIKSVKYGKKYTYLTVASTSDLEVGNYISIAINQLTPYECNETTKFKVAKLKDDNKIVIDGILKDLPTNEPLSWKLVKDDIAYTDIFEFQKKDSYHRSIVAKYCIQDNILCNKLMDKLKILVNNIGMANVCYVPMSYLFLRGQGIKIYSLVAKVCLEEGYIIPDKTESGDGEKFQGATVLEARAGGYFKPVSCNDFASLYPSSIISHNLSPDTFMKNPSRFSNYPTNVIDCGSGGIYTFLKPEQNYDGGEADRPGRGIIPKVLINLLGSRKRVKKLMAQETDVFQKSIYDGLQLAYKLTCNSIYGQMGSTFSQIACKPVAVSTTAVGRQLLEIAAKETRILYPEAEIIYGDTDSIMTSYPVGLTDNPTPEEKREALKKSIECAQKVEEIVSGKLPWPHKLEYEKTYYPYILYSKKRYSGVMYEFDVDNYTKIDNKGIVLKRRDNANIVKYVFGKALDIIMFEQDIDKAHEFVKQTLLDLCNGKFSLDFLVISKTLKITKTEPAHKILAERMRKRDPGTAPNLNDRVPYIYIQRSKKETNELLSKQNRKTLLQGDKIEHPDYVVANNLKPDYLHYITKQIMKPLLELLGIFEQSVVMPPNATETEIKQVSNQRESIVEKKVFSKIINQQRVLQNGMTTIDMFFK
jgi:DNA polymerase elongation subunit (family B)